jgi:hypothetical protein
MVLSEDSAVGNNYREFVSGRETYVARYLAGIAADGSDLVAAPDRRRIVVLTAAFTPMVAVAALPVTVIVAGAASVVANLTWGWLGVVVLVGGVLVIGYMTARLAGNYQDVPANRGPRRWLPLGATVVVVGVCLSEMVSGSRIPDPVIVLCFASMVWIVGVLPLAAGHWGPTRRALWVLAPTVMFVTIVFVWTHGLFWLRFSSAVGELDAIAERAVNGDQITDDTHANGFTVHHITVGQIGRNPACDVGLWISGWHEDDTRYIAHCNARPTGDFTHLADDWWQLAGKQPPSDL